MANQKKGIRVFRVVQVTKIDRSSPLRRIGNIVADVLGDYLPFVGIIGALIIFTFLVKLLARILK